MIELHIANPTHLSKMLMRNITVLLFVVFLSVNALIGLADNPEHHRVVILDKNAKNNTHGNTAPSVIPIDCIIDESMMSVEVTFTSGIEDATVRLTNLTTGEITTTYGNTSTMLVPVPGEGQYMIEIILSSGREYYGLFEATIIN